MSTHREIKQHFLLQKAMALVASATNEILATMELKEEKKHPLPCEYFFILQKKAREGVKIIRLGFGTKTNFEIIKKRLKIQQKNYIFLRAVTNNYKRMLLVDRIHLLFATNYKGGKKFFYTNDTDTISDFYHYFTNELGKIKRP